METRGQTTNGVDRGRTKLSWSSKGRSDTMRNHVKQENDKPARMTHDWPDLIVRAKAYAKGHDHVTIKMLRVKFGIKPSAAYELWKKLPNSVKKKSPVKAQWAKVKVQSKKATDRRYQTRTMLAVLERYAKVADMTGNSGAIFRQIARRIEKK